MRSPAALIYSHFDVVRDFQALLAFRKKVEEADRAGEDVSEAALRAELSVPGHNASQDRWVVRLHDNPQLVGYGVIFKAPGETRADIYIAVRPEWRRLGIGRDLLVHLLERARQLKVREVGAYVAVQNAGATAFLSKFGFEPVAGYMRMRASAEQSFPPPKVPKGFVIRSYAKVERLEVLTEAFNRSFEGLWGHNQITQESVAALLPKLQPEGIFLLFARDKSIAGMCRATLDEHLSRLSGQPTGLIDAPGVVPEYREAGLHQPLLLKAISWLLTQKPVNIALESWGDSAATLQRYRDLGFSVENEEIAYRRKLV
ncbi:GNAT family N-acetyltransferase [Ktedonosporobacter rubrisoli]|uniref:GNAT family N-acetyltransferase n=1 Tax=Ktedonosporobacter rubrisoli TaxID=2509675 RepID=A0A4P6JMD4_KTERU|nr:GNAT family N-acetyltransferase [Ktedonosporobacter rubrisoli]QBD75836.1 GNAT family N-acetyltransferase [Ktedonosporobacter rubrisoli]